VVLVDSSVWIAYFNGLACRETDLLDEILERDFVLVADLVLAEVLRGFDEPSEFEKARRALAGLEQVRVGGADNAIRAARHFQALRRRGVRAGKTVDLLIATWCITEAVPLLHRDRDYDAYVRHLGLEVV